MSDATTPDIHTFTGAYALNALDPVERAAFEQHLEHCEACQQEIREFEATAASLGSAVSVAPPRSMKADVMAAIATVRQEPPTVVVPEDADDTVVPFQRRPVFEPGWAERLLMPAAAVIAIVVLGVSVLFGVDRQSREDEITALETRIAQLESATGGVAEVVAAPDLQTWEVEGPAGSSARVVYSATRGEGWFLAAGMAAAPAGQAYALWLIDDEGPTAAGLFDTTTGTVAHAITGDVPSAAAVGVTLEPAGGSPAPTSDVLMLIEL